MILFVLNDSSSIKKCGAYIKKNRVQDFSIFVGEYRQEDIPNDLREKVLVFPELSEAEQDLIDKTGTQIANEFSKIKSIQESTRYKEVNLMFLLVHGTDYFWIWVLKQVLILKKVIQNKKPSQIVVGNDQPLKGPYFAPQEKYYSQIAVKLASAFNIPISNLSNSNPVNAAAISSISTRQNIFEEIIFSMLSSFQSLLFGVVNQHKPKVVISTSMRVGGKLLDDQSFDWIHVGRRASLKSSLLLMRKKVTSRAFFSNGASDIQKNWIDDQKIANDPLFQFEGISVFSFFQPRMKSIISKDFPVLINWINEAFRFLNSSDVRCLVLDEDVSFFPKTLAETANVLGIPSVVIQHGVTGHARGFLPNSASKVAVWGDISKKQLTSWGIASEKISVTGFPGLDKKQNSEIGFDKDSIKKELSIDADKKVIFFPANRLRTMNHGLSRVKATKHQGLEFFKSVVVAANNFPDCVLVVKVHPGDKIENFSQFLKEQSLGGYANVRIIDQFDLKKLYAITDIVVNHSSTVCLEAMAHDIPVVNVNLFNKIDYIPFGENGPVYQVRQSSEIGTAIAQVLANPSELSNQRKQFLSEYCGPMDGKSSERIIQLIRNLMSAKQQEKKEEINNEHFVNRS